MYTSFNEEFFFLMPAVWCSYTASTSRGCSRFHVCMHIQNNFWLWSNSDNINCTT